MVEIVCAGVGAGRAGADSRKRDGRRERKRRPTESSANMYDHTRAHVVADWKKKRKEVKERKKRKEQRSHSRVLRSGVPEPRGVFDTCASFSTKRSMPLLFLLPGRNPGGRASLRKNRSCGPVGLGPRNRPTDNGGGALYPDRKRPNSPARRHRRRPPNEGRRPSPPPPPPLPSSSSLLLIPAAAYFWPFFFLASCFW